MNHSMTGRRPIPPIAAMGLIILLATISHADRPNIILLLADDMGNAQVGYRNHPVLQTPNIDALAAGGLRLDRFYAAAPVCSPTRASLLTGRHPVRCGVPEHGYALRTQEWTLPAALARAGYATAHFGKWHLNGHRGPGVPIDAADPRNPGRFGFEHWVSTSNYFDIDPILSHGGRFVEHQGDSSEIIVDEALKFLDQQNGDPRPFFAVIWYGSPHSPFRSSEADVAKLTLTTRQALNDASQKHHGELVAMDRSIGTLMRGLGERQLTENTLVWFTSDNGGLGNITPSTVGTLKGNKNTLDEGGLRVPAVVHWPAEIAPGLVDQTIAGSVDFAPTIMDIVNRPDLANPLPVDGVSLTDRWKSETEPSSSDSDRHLGFEHRGRVVITGQRYKQSRRGNDDAIYYDLLEDPGERRAITPPSDVVEKMLEFELQWLQSIRHSVAGGDYRSGVVDPLPDIPIPWYDDPAYQPYLDRWRQRPEYESWLTPTVGLTRPVNRPRRSKPTG